MNAGIRGIAGKANMICEFDDCNNRKGNHKFSENYCKCCMFTKFNKYHIPKIILINMNETYKVGQKLCEKYDLPIPNIHPFFKIVTRRLRNGRKGKWGHYSDEKNEIMIFLRKSTSEIRYLEMYFHLITHHFVDRHFGIPHGSIFKSFIKDLLKEMNYEWNGEKIEKIIRNKSYI
jgi:hypothetical protein